MKTLIVSNAFRKDLRRAIKRGKSAKKVQAVIDLLLADEPLPLRCRPHKLSGDYSGQWECHIEPDWLLIYQITSKEVELFRTRTHSDLFG